MSSTIITLLVLCSTQLITITARNISYDSRSFLFDGERRLILSGSVHPTRVHPAEWPRVISLATEMGLNTLQIYVMWDELQPHGPEQAFDFSGPRNYSAFLRLVQAAGMDAVVRLGPYVCGEHQGGGIPLWMRQQAACYRCSDPGWKKYMAAALAAFVSEFVGNGLLASDGGPIIMLQVENEYNGPDIAYLTWAVAVARNLTTAVPWILCHDLELCSQINNGSTSPSPDSTRAGLAVCTINGFWMEQSSPFVDQPSLSWITMQRARNPAQPMFWTEDQAWFDTHGVGQRVRHTSDMLYGFARWVALGGAAHNYYILTGGTNWNLTSSENVVSAYAPDAAIDWLLLRHQPKFNAYATWLHVLANISADLLGNAPHSPVPLSAACEAREYGTVALVSNMAGSAANTSSALACQVLYRGVSLYIPPHTVVVVTGGVDAGPSSLTILFNTSAWGDSHNTDTRHPSTQPAAIGVTQATSWQYYEEEFAFGTKYATAATGEPPLEQMRLTQNWVDYMWYETYVTLPHAPPAGTRPINFSVSASMCGGEYVYAFVDRVPLAEQRVGLAQPGEGRGEQTTTGSGRPPRVHVFSGPTRPNDSQSATMTARESAAMPGTGGSDLPQTGVGATVRVSLMVAAMGMISVPISPADCKGPRVVLLHAPQPGGKMIVLNITTNGWNQTWMTLGDSVRAYDPATASTALPWADVVPAESMPPATARAVWFRALIPTPSTPGASVKWHAGSASGSPAPQLAFALNLTGMAKGVAYVNGWPLGRYNLEPGRCSGPCSAPEHPGCVIFWRPGACGQPTQSLYAVPAPVLHAPDGEPNLVVLFEESDAPPGTAPPPPPPPPASAPTWIDLAAAAGLPAEDQQSDIDDRGLRLEPVGPGMVELAEPFARNLSLVSLVALIDHPPLD